MSPLGFEEWHWYLLFLPINNIACDLLSWFRVGIIDILVTPLTLAATLLLFMINCANIATEA